STPTLHHPPPSPPRPPLCRRNFDCHRLLVSSSRRGFRRMPHGHRPHQTERADLEEGARSGRRGVGGMAEIVRDDQLPAGAGTAREVVPIPAASVLLLRDDPLEVLMIRRHERSSFVPNAWVFPGGAVDEADAALSDGSIVNTMR